MKTESTEEFLARGGKITHCPPGVPKDLYGLKYRGLFGGAKAFSAGLAKRNDSGSGDLFNLVAVPFVKGHKVKG